MSSLHSINDDCALLGTCVLCETPFYLQTKARAPFADQKNKDCVSVRRSTDGTAEDFGGKLAEDAGSLRLRQRLENSID